MPGGSKTRRSENRFHCQLEQYWEKYSSSATIVPKVLSKGSYLMTGNHETRTFVWRCHHISKNLLVCFICSAPNWFDCTAKRPHIATVKYCSHWFCVLLLYFLTRHPKNLTNRRKTFLCTKHEQCFRFKCLFGYSYLFNNAYVVIPTNCFNSSSCSTEKYQLYMTRLIGKPYFL